MSNFKKIIKKYISNTINENDKRIMLVAVNLLELEPVITDEEIEVLNEIFKALKEDYTLSLATDKETLQFEILITKQELPIIENKHNINTLYNKLSEDTKELNKLEQSVLTFFNACEHVEEDEVILIERVVKLLENNWSLQPIESQNKDGELVRYSRFVFNSDKRLIKTK